MPTQELAMTSANIPVLTVLATWHHRFCAVVPLICIALKQYLEIFLLKDQSHHDLFCFY